MVATVPADLIINFILGLSIAYSGRMDLRRTPRSVLATRYFAALLLLVGLVYLPVGGYLYWFHTDWSWMYLVAPARLPGGMGILVLAAYAASAFAGYGIGAVRLRDGKERSVVVIATIAAVALAAVTVLLRRRLYWVGSYAQFHAGFPMQAIFRTRLVAALVVMGGAVLFGWAFILYRFARDRG